MPQLTKGGEIAVRMVSWTDGDNRAVALEEVPVVLRPDEIETWVHPDLYAEIRIPVTAQHHAALSVRSENKGTEHTLLPSTFNVIDREAADDNVAVLLSTDFFCKYQCSISFAKGCQLKIKSTPVKYEIDDFMREEEEERLLELQKLRQRAEIAQKSLKKAQEKLLELGGHQKPRRAASRTPSSLQSDRLGSSLLVSPSASPSQQTTPSRESTPPTRPIRMAKGKGRESTPYEGPTTRAREKVPRPPSADIVTERAKKLANILQRQQEAQDGRWAQHERGKTRQEPEMKWTSTHSSRRL